MARPKKQHLKPRPDGRYVCRYKDQFFYRATEDEALQARENLENVGFCRFLRVFHESVNIL